jgi:hypothetical protein
MTLRTQLLANKVEHVFHPATNASPEAKAAVTQIVINTHEALDSESKKELIAVVTKAVSILPASAQVEFVKYAKQADPASLPDSNETDSKDDQPSNELPSQDKLFGNDSFVIMSPVNPDPTTPTNTEVSTNLVNFVNPDDLFGNDSLVIMSPVNPDPTTPTNTEVSTNLVNFVNPEDLFGND